MSQRTNFQVARVFGVRIGVGMSWFFMLFLMIYVLSEYFHEVLGGSVTTAYLVALAVVLSFFLSVIAHELGHALVARRNGLQVEGIDLWAFGGMTRTQGVHTSPGVLLRVAIAGPLVTLALIGLCVLAAVLALSGKRFFEVAAGTGGIRATPVLVWLSWVTTINLLVLLFNLVPAFPLDGGQIAQAIIWWRTKDRNRALSWTGRAGQVLALLLGASGVVLLAAMNSYGLFTLVLAFILYQGASGAVRHGSLGQRMQSVKVSDIMDTEPVTIYAETSLLDAQEDFFLRYRWPWFAVVDRARHFLGVVRAERVDQEISAGRPALTVVEVLEQDLPVLIDEEAPLESLLRSEGLRRLGAMVAVDGEGVLQGVVTLAQIRQALRPIQGS